MVVVVGASGEEMGVFANRKCAMCFEFCNGLFVAVVDVVDGVVEEGELELCSLGNASDEEACNNDG